MCRIFYFFCSVLLLSARFKIVSIRCFFSFLFYFHFASSFCENAQHRPSFVLRIIIDIATNIYTCSGSGNAFATWERLLGGNIYMCMCIHMVALRKLYVSFWCSVETPKFGWLLCAHRLKIGHTHTHKQHPSSQAQAFNTNQCKPIVWQWRLLLFYMCIIMCTTHLKMLYMR